jgi:hypothetical protein
LGKGDRITWFWRAPPKGSACEVVENTAFEGRHV